MSPDDPRHGKVAGYSAHRRAGERACGACRAAMAKDFNLRQLHGRTTRPALGTQRRIQALSRLGWTLEEIAREAGYSDLENVHQILRRTRVADATYKRIADAFARMSMQVPPPQSQRRRVVNAAIRRGWAPPLAWDDIDNDPEPNVDTKFYKKNFIRDEVAIQRVLDGDGKIARHLTPAEREEVVQRWAGSLAELERITGWNVHRYTHNDAA